MKAAISQKAMVLLGASNSNLAGSSKIAKTEHLCEELVTGAIEEVTLAVKWSFALKRVASVDNDRQGEFKAIEGVTDCIKVAIITPSNLEWYTGSGRIYFKGNKLSTLFYYSKSLLDSLLSGEPAISRQVPESFKLLAALSLASQVSFALYADSVFTDGLKKQFLLKLEEVRRTYSIDYNLINSAEV